MTKSSDASVWKALSDPTRRELLDLIAPGPITTGELVAKIPRLCRTAVMKHLDVLEAADLIHVRRQGRLRWNVFNALPLERIVQRWVTARMSRMSSSLERLKSVVEAPVLLDSHQD